MKKVFDECVKKNVNGYLVSWQDYDREKIEYATVAKDNIHNFISDFKKSLKKSYWGIEIVSILDLSKPYLESEVNLI